MPLRTVTPTDFMGRPVGPSRTRALVDGHRDDSEVPRGTIADVTGWVGYDPDRAKAALVTEHAKSVPRPGLIAALERVLKES